MVRLNSSYYDTLPPAYVPTSVEPQSFDPDHAPTEHELVREEVHAQVASYAESLLERKKREYDLPREYERMQLVKRGLEHAAELLADLMAEGIIDFPHATQCLRVVRRRLDHAYEPVAVVPPYTDNSRRAVNRIITRTGCDEVHFLVERIIKKNALFIHGERYAEECVRRLRYVLSHARGARLLRSIQSKLHRALGTLESEPEADATVQPKGCSAENILHDRSTVEAAIYRWIAAAMRELFGQKQTGAEHSAHGVAPE